MGSFISIPIVFILQKVFGNDFYPFGLIFQKIKSIFGFKYESKVKSKTKRFDFFDVFATNDLKKLGILSNDKEWELELPNQFKRENISIIGVNSWGQVLQLNIDWRPQTLYTSYIKVGFKFETGDGNTYHMNEQNLISFDKNSFQYKAPGIALEILNPFKRLRIKFRGYLHKKYSNELIFMKIRIIWISVSNVFDFECDHKKEFIDNEIKNNCVNKWFNKIKFENRFEQIGQMKGTFVVQGRNEEKLFLWGNKSKKYVEECGKRQIHRLFGYSKKGWVFHIGSVVDYNNKIRYRYGFMYWGKCLIFPVESLSDIDLTTQSFTEDFCFIMKSLNKTFEVSVNKGSVNDNVFQLTINGSEGMAVHAFEREDTTLDIENIKSISNQIYFPFVERTDDLVVTINDRKAENVLISGGKGSSLASLNYLSESLKNSMNILIPKGIVVSTNAYQLTVKQNKQIKQSIDRLKGVVSKPELLKTECLKVSIAFKCSQLPQEIRDEIRLKLKTMFNENDLYRKVFAVRSSASGEDSEDMSTAGQMTTYLGVRGLDSIYSSVLKCWSSQFEFSPVEYKRGYGQDINSPMAVIIQEMIDCDSAGVLFTCDPLSGDERDVVITGNYGIGQSVVSALSEPDTIRVTVNITNNSLSNRRVDSIKSVSIGSKEKTINIDGSGSGTVVVDNYDVKHCCISDGQAIKLTEIALEIQKFFGCVRDIEWGIKDNKIYILQCRPISNLDSGFTEFELLHELDGGLPSEEEYITRANIGEVFPGALSTMCSTLLLLWGPLFIKELNRTIGLPVEIYCPYAPVDTTTVCNYRFAKLKNTQCYKFLTKSEYCKAMTLAIFGHELDPEIIDACKGIDEPESFSVRFWRIFYLAPYMVFPNYFISKSEKEIHNYRYILDDEFETIRDMFNAITSKVMNTIDKIICHYKASQSSTMYNNYLIRILSEHKNNTNNDIISDFTFLMSSCGQLVSAEVPSDLRELAQSIEEPKLFRQLSDENALQYLRNNSRESGRKFKKFLTTHEHRGYKEFDPLYRMWKMDPIPVIQSLKTMLSTDASTYKSNEKRSTGDIINSIKTPLSYQRKMVVKCILLPLAKRAVAMRERTKSLAVYGVDLCRQALWALADRMHSEGLIPENELLFHMTLDEINYFIDTRNPIIIAKAQQRKRLHYKFNDWKFDEIVMGYDFQPRHLLENGIEITGNEVITGTPVSIGRVVARVCVAQNLEDAHNIKSGDILVTYSTDIGWSPYFPMISGIATELGGLISHGAVIAREYGIPCMVGIKGVCNALKSGDLVLLDCNKGIITKVMDNN